MDKCSELLKFQFFRTSRLLIATHRQYDKFCFSTTVSTSINKYQLGTTRLRFVPHKRQPICLVDNVHFSRLHKFEVVKYS